MGITYTAGGVGTADIAVGAVDADALAALAVEEAKIAADAVTSDKIDGSVVQISADVELSADDIKGMYVSPKKVLDAVAGKIILVEWIDFIMTRTSTAYTDGDSVHFRYENNGPLIANITDGYIKGDPPPDAGTFAISKAAMGRSGDDLTDLVGLGIFISNPNRAYATGTGTAVARIRYRLITPPS